MMNRNIVVIGTQFGDEGKAKIVSDLSIKSNTCARFNGGSNAGHTVYSGDQKFVFHLIPSGMLNGNTGVITNGCVIDPIKLLAEMNEMRSRGIKISPANLKISYACHITTEIHKAIDAYTEEKLGDKKIGSTKTGNSPTAIDKYARRGIRMLELTNPEKLKSICSFDLYNEQSSKYKMTLPYSVFIEQLEAAGQELLPYMTDTSLYLSNAVIEGGVIFEGAQSTLLDIDYSAYPNCTAGNCLASYAAVSGGFDHRYIDEIVGVVKAFVSQVGSGYLPTRMPEEIEGTFREFAGEYGATTSRPRKLGWLDIPMLKYSARVNGLTSLAITRLDTLGYFDEVFVCDYYTIDGENIYDMPMDRDMLSRAIPHYIKLEGWAGKEISNIREKKYLPTQILDFIDMLEGYIGVRVKYISVGKNKEEIIECNNEWNIDTLIADAQRDIVLRA
jgi:adenylosuccinate synthase